MITINQARMPWERARALRRTERLSVVRSLNRTVRRGLRKGLWSLSDWAEGRGHSLDGLRRRVPYVDRSLAFR